MALYTGKLDPRRWPGSSLERGCSLDGAAEAVGLAGEAALRHYHRGVIVETKGDGTPSRLPTGKRRRLPVAGWSSVFPPTGSRRGAGSTRPEARRRWILRSHRRHQDLRPPRPAVGNAGGAGGGRVGARRRGILPAVGGSWWSPRGGAGCRWNGRPAQVSTVGGLESAAVLCSDERQGTAGRSDGGFARARCTGGPRADLGRLLRLSAGGHRTGRGDGRRADGPRDAAALQPIIEEAGGVFTDWAGRSTAFGRHTVATNAALAAGRGRCSLRPADAGRPPGRGHPSDCPGHS